VGKRIKLSVAQQAIVACLFRKAGKERDHLSYVRVARRIGADPEALRLVRTGECPLAFTSDQLRLLCSLIDCDYRTLLAAP
jgi:hypothetical protein